MQVSLRGKRQNSQGSLTNFRRRFSHGLSEDSHGEIGTVDGLDGVLTQPETQIPPNHASLLNNNDQQESASSDDCCSQNGWKKTLGARELDWGLILSVFSFTFFYHLDLFNPYLTPYMLVYVDSAFLNNYLLPIRLVGSALSTLILGSLMSKYSYKLVYSIQLLFFFVSLAFYYYFPSSKWMLLSASFLRGLAIGGNSCTEMLSGYYVKKRQSNDFDSVIDAANFVGAFVANLLSQFLYLKLGTAKYFILGHIGALALSYICALFLFSRPPVDPEEDDEEDSSSDGEENEENAPVEVEVSSSQGEEKSDCCLEMINYSCPGKDIWKVRFKPVYYAVLFFAVTFAMLNPLAEIYIGSLWFAVNPDVKLNAFVDLAGRLMNSLGTKIVKWVIIDCCKNRGFLALIICFLLCGVLCGGMSVCRNIYASYALYLVFTLVKRIDKYSIRQYLRAGLREKRKNGKKTYHAPAYLGRFTSLGMVLALALQYGSFPFVKVYVKEEYATYWKYAIIGGLYVFFGLIMLLGAYRRWGKLTELNEKVITNSNKKRKRISALSDTPIGGSAKDSKNGA